MTFSDLTVKLLKFNVTPESLQHSLNQNDSLKTRAKGSSSFQNFFQRLEKSLSKSESFEEVRQSICCLNEIAQPRKTFSLGTVMKITQMYLTLTLQSDREIAFAFIKRFLTEPNDQEEKRILLVLMKFRSLTPTLSEF